MMWRCCSAQHFDLAVERHQAGLDGKLGLPLADLLAEFRERRPVRLGLHLGHRLAAGLRSRVAAGELGVPGDRRQRRPQLVRGVGDEPPDLLLATVPGTERGLAVPDATVCAGTWLTVGATEALNVIVTLAVDVPTALVTVSSTVFGFVGFAGTEIAAMDPSESIWTRSAGDDAIGVDQPSVPSSCSRKTLIASVSTS